MSRLTNTATQAGRRHTVVPARPRRKMSKLAARRVRFALLALLPVMAIFVYLRVIPIGQTLTMSFFDWKLVAPAQEFVGFDNFVKLLGDRNFHTALANTLIFAVAVTAVSVVIALLLAVPLAQYRTSRWRGVLEVLFFAPIVLPIVPLAIGWRMLLAYPDGPINSVLTGIGLPAVPWLTNPNAALVSVIMLSAWKQIGYNMILFVVGIRAIPAMYSEAARVDGANNWQVFRHITLPLIRPITLFITVITTISAFNVFTQVYVLASDTQGSPGWLVRVLVYDIFENGFRFYKMGYASAEALYLFAIVLVLTLFQFRLAKERL